AHTSLVKIFKSIFAAEIALRINAQGAVFREAIIHTSPDQMGNIHLFVIAVLVQDWRDVWQGGHPVFIALSKSPPVLIVIAAIDVEFSEIGRASCRERWC